MFKRFIHYYKPYKKLFVLDMLASFLISLIGMGYPILTNFVLDKVVPNEEVDNNEKIITIVIIGSLLLLIYIIRTFLRYFVQYKGHVMGVQMQADMRRDIFKKIQQLPFSYYDEHETGKIMSRMTNDLQDVSELAHHGPENLFISGMSLIASFTYLMFIEWRFALILLLSVPLMVGVSVFTRKQMRKAFTETRKSIAEINASTESSISGIRVTKAFNNSEKEIEKFEQSNKSYVEARSRAYKKMGQFQSSTMFITDLFNALLLSVGGILVVLNTGDFNLASYVSFVVTVGLFINPLTTLINFVEQYQNGVTGFKRFLEIMDEPVEKEDENPFDKERLNGEIEFKNVNFDYDTTKGVLNNVSFKINMGEKVAFVGPSGGGKTTICHLIPNFYKVSDGQILIDNVDINKLTFRTLRENIGIVQQDVFLFNGTIKENILYGRLDATDEEVVEAARKANILDFVNSLENGFDTEIGERGVKLSGGQKQRISIARVFLKNPPILILDEATSALDNTTEVMIQDSLKELTEGRTTLVVAHRLSTIKNASIIYVVEEGKIVEKGSHEELLNIKNGKFKTLYEAQFKKDLI